MQRQIGPTLQKTRFFRKIAARETIPFFHDVRYSKTARKSGFALIIVIWGIGIVSLLAVTFMVTARMRTQLTGNLLVSARAEALAEAGINIAVSNLIISRLSQKATPTRFPPSGSPIACSMPNNSIAIISIEDEGGKIDINGASKGLLSRLFVGVGVNGQKASDLAQSIINFRSSKPKFSDINTGRNSEYGVGSSVGPKFAQFQTTLELEQVSGMTSVIFHKILPFVTVYSRTDGFDPSKASPYLLSLLSNDKTAGPTFPLEQDSFDAEKQQAMIGLEQFYAPSISNTFLVRAEVVFPNRTIFVREAILELVRTDPRKSIILEWRRGDNRYAQTVEKILLNKVKLPDC